MFKSDHTSVETIMIIIIINYLIELTKFYMTNIKII